MIAPNEARRHARDGMPRAPRSSPTAARWSVPKIALIVAAAYVALAVGTPWLLRDAPPLVYEVVAERAFTAGASSGREDASPAWTVASFE